METHLGGVHEQAEGTSNPKAQSTQRLATWILLLDIIVHPMGPTKYPNKRGFRVPEATKLTLRDRFGAGI